MGDISTFPTIHRTLIRGDNIGTFTATEAVTAGQVVGIAATGVSNAVVPMDKTSGEQSLGTALYSQGAGEKVAVAMDGCVVTVVNADDTTGIDAGSIVGQDDNAVQGTVLAATAFAVGIVLEDIAGGGSGKMLVSSAVGANA